MGYSVNERVIAKNPIHLNDFTIPINTPGIIERIVDTVVKTYSVLFDGYVSAIQVTEGDLSPLNGNAKFTSSLIKQTSSDEVPIVTPSSVLTVYAADNAPASSNENQGIWRDIVRTIIGGIALFGLAIMIIVIFLNINEYSEVGWARATYLLSGVEAIAFAAAGYFFGNQVNRVRAEKAENEVEKQKKRTDEKDKETQNAKEEAAKIKTENVKIKSSVSELTRSLGHRISPNKAGRTEVERAEPIEQNSLLADIQRINELVQ